MKRVLAKDEEQLREFYFQYALLIGFEEFKEVIILLKEYVRQVLYAEAFPYTRQGLLFFNDSRIMQDVPVNATLLARLEAREKFIVAAKKNQGTKEPASLNEEVTGMDDGFELGDTVTSPDFKDELDRQREFTNLIERLVESGGLLPKEVKVLKLRYGIDCHDAHTLEEVGVVLGITREQARQIESKAMRKASSYFVRLDVTPTVLG